MARIIINMFFFFCLLTVFISSIIFMFRKSRLTHGEKISLATLILIIFYLLKTSLEDIIITINIMKGVVGL